MKIELNPTKKKTHKESISNFKRKNKNIFCLVGLKHSFSMQNILDNDYLILNDIHSLVNMGSEKRELLSPKLKDKNIFFLTTSYNDYLAVLTDLKHYFKHDIQTFCIDLEVLKAYETIPQDELNLNDYTLGIELSNGDTFQDYINEIETENRNAPMNINDYLEGILTTEINRQLKRKKQFIKGRK